MGRLELEHLEIGHGRGFANVLLGSTGAERYNVQNGVGVVHRLEIVQGNYHR